MGIGSAKVIREGHRHTPIELLHRSRLQSLGRCAELCCLRGRRTGKRVALHASRCRGGRDGTHAADARALRVEEELGMEGCRCELRRRAEANDVRPLTQQQLARLAVILNRELVASGIPADGTRIIAEARCVEAIVIRLQQEESAATAHERILRVGCEAGSCVSRLVRGGGVEKQLNNIIPLGNGVAIVRRRAAGCLGKCGSDTAAGGAAGGGGALA
jgi:hypothetical protein